MNNALSNHNWIWSDNIYICNLRRSDLPWHVWYIECDRKERELNSTWENGILDQYLETVKFKNSHNKAQPLFTTDIQ